MITNTDELQVHFCSSLETLLPAPVVYPVGQANSLHWILASTKSSPGGTAKVVPTPTSHLSPISCAQTYWKQKLLRQRTTFFVFNLIRVSFYVKLVPANAVLPVGQR